MSLPLAPVPAVLRPKRQAYGPVPRLAMLRGGTPVVCAPVLNEVVGTREGAVPRLVEVVDFSGFKVLHTLTLPVDSVLEKLLLCERGTTQRVEIHSDRGRNQAPCRGRTQLGIEISMQGRERITRVICAGWTPLERIESVRDQGRNLCLCCLGAHRAQGVENNGCLIGEHPMPGCVYRNLHLNR